MKNSKFKIQDLRLYTLRILNLQSLIFNKIKKENGGK